MGKVLVTLLMQVWATLGQLLGKSWVTLGRIYWISLGLVNFTLHVFKVQLQCTIVMSKRNFNGKISAVRTEPSPVFAKSESVAVTTVFA